MQALVFQGPRAMAWREWPDPEVRAGEALIRVDAVGICGSDVHGYTGESGRRTPPLVMGHEATGEIMRVGPGVPPEWIGARVVIQPILFCGRCDECEVGRPHRCRHRQFLGGNVDGAMAERIAVPVSNLLRLPAGLNPVHATLAEPLAVALHAVRQAGDLAGRTVLVAGSGPIGVLTVAAARQAEARRIVTTDVAADRRAMAMAHGADASLDPAQVDLPSALADTIGLPEVDVAFDAVGIPATFNQGLIAARPGGTVVAIGGWCTVPVDLSRIVTRELQVIGTFNYTPVEFAEALSWLSAGRIDASNLVARVAALDEGAAVFAELSEGQVVCGKVVLVAPGRAM